jgi:hypothetical protein
MSELFHCINPQAAIYYFVLSAESFLQPLTSQSTTSSLSSMHYTYIVLGLVAAASAVDIRLYDNESHCNGGVWTSCTNIAANTCCQGSNSHRTTAINFIAIPSNWRLVTRSYTSLNCDRNSLSHEFFSNGATSVCHGGGWVANWYGGGGYSFVSKKRTEEDSCDAIGGSCARSQKPDILVKDGQKYAIADLDEATLEQLVCFVFSSQK